MLAQYYSNEKFIRIFPDGNSVKIVDIPIKGNALSRGNIRNTLKDWGFPSFSNWEKTRWGYQLNFKFEVTQIEEL